MSVFKRANGNKIIIVGKTLFLEDSVRKNPHPGNKAMLETSVHFENGQSVVVEGKLEDVYEMLKLSDAFALQRSLQKYESLIERTIDVSINGSQTAWTDIPIDPSSIPVGLNTPPDIETPPTPPTPDPAPEGVNTKPSRGKRHASAR